MRVVSLLNRIEKFKSFVDKKAFFLWRLTGKKRSSSRSGPERIARRSSRVCMK